MRYLITFTCYGARLHGDESGSVDRHHNLPGSPTLEPDSERKTRVRQTMLDAPYLLDEESRATVLASIRKHCVHRAWNLLAAHVRSNHVHAIVEAEIRPERIMNEFKSWASRDLNRHGMEAPTRRRWGRHGSTRWLRKDQDVLEAIRYVTQEQGEPLALFVSSDL